MAAESSAAAGVAATDTELPPRLLDEGVLVVDDSDVQRLFAVDALRSLGIRRVEQAADGTQAMQLLQSGRPTAVVVVDLEMPGMDGVELLHHIARARLRPAIIVASSRELMLISSVATMVQNLGLPLLGALSKPLSAAVLGGLLRGMASIDRTPAERAPQMQFSYDELQRAIVMRDIIPFFQPKALLRDGSVFGAEALARWRRGGSVLEPGAFLQQIEDHGLMSALTLSILDQTIEHLLHWQRDGIKLSVAINLSPKSLDDMQLADALIRRVEASPLEDHSILFEVTENAMIGDMAGAMGSLLRLRLRGFELAIDDYGTGFSSMQQLSCLPFSELKIDRSFVSGVHRERPLRTLLESAIDVGARLGLRTVAEGIESEEEWQLLKQLRCHAGQGYLIARPMEGDAIPAALPAIAARLARL